MDAKLLGPERMARFGNRNKGIQSDTPKAVVCVEKKVLDFSIRSGIVIRRTMVNGSTAQFSKTINEPSVLSGFCQVGIHNPTNK